MTKYIVAYGEDNIFTVQIPTIFTSNGVPDFHAMFKKVKEWNKEATISLA